MRRFIRGCAWFAIATQPLFVAAWITAGALQPHYSAAHSSISSLAASGMRHPGVMIAGLVLLGVGLAALAPGLNAVLPSRPATRVAMIMFVIAGLGFVVARLARLDRDLSQAAFKAPLDAH